MRLSPEIVIVVSPRRGQSRGPRQATNSWSTQPAWSRRGRRNMANDHKGFPGTWETLSSPSRIAGGRPAYQLQVDPQLRVLGWRGRTRDATMVSPSEGNEVRRDGRQGVGASRSTAEPGEPPEGPWGGKGTPFYEPLEGNMTGTSRPETVSTKQQRIAKLARDCPDMAFTNLAHHIDIDWLLQGLCAHA